MLLAKAIQVAGTSAMSVLCSIILVLGTAFSKMSIYVKI